MLWAPTFRCRLNTPTLPLEWPKKCTDVFEHFLSSFVCFTAQMSCINLFVGLKKQVMQKIAKSLLTRKVMKLEKWKSKVKAIILVDC
jgi:hypothetical protein